MTLLKHHMNPNPADRTDHREKRHAAAFIFYSIKLPGVLIGGASCFMDNSTENGIGKQSSNPGWGSYVHFVLMPLGNA